MKYLIAGMILFSLSATAQEQALVWQTDVMKAVDMSLKEKKPLFLFFTGSDWCGWCKRLQSEVFLKPQFQDWAKKNVIPVELDFPRMKQIPAEMQKQNMELAQIFGISGYPTIVFVSPDKKENQVVFNRLGSAGYMAGGPDVWLDAADKFLPPNQ